MSDIPALDARMTTSATTPHGSLDSAAHASNDGAAAGAQAVTEHANAAGDLSSGGVAGEGGASGWLDGGFDLAASQLGSLMLELKAMFEAVLPL
jgi:hypothetical protein